MLNKNSRILIVGSSGRLNEEKLGSIIDTYDVVCRINMGGSSHCVKNENKNIIGNRTDIWFALSHTSLIKENPYFNFKYSTIFTENWRFFYAYKNKFLNLKLFPQNINETVEKQLLRFNDFQHKPTSGIKVLFYFIKHFLNEDKTCLGTVYNNIHLCGFDGFESGHWYGNKFIKNQKASDLAAYKGTGKHFTSKEFEYFKFLEENNLIKFI